MSTIITRSGKGSPLTNDEVDSNFTNLNADKLESGDLSVVTTAVGTAALAYNSGVFTYTPPDLTAIDLSLYAPLAGATFTGPVIAPTFEGSLNGNQLFKAQAGEALTKGVPVYISGISGNTPIVMKADADDPAKMPAFGLSQSAANLNAAVNVITYGQLHNIDTSAYALGQTLYVATTPGGLVASPPSGESSLIQNMGKVERVHPSTGTIFVAGAGRTNATPNLNEGKFFLGNALNKSVSADFSDTVAAQLAGTVTLGDVYSTGSVEIDGNLTVHGTTVTINATELAIQDNMIYLNEGSAVTNPDLGIAGGYNDGTYAHAGIFRDATDGIWKVYDGYLPEPDASPYIDITDASFTIADMQVNTLYAAGGDSTNWNTAYSWGDHSTAGYLTSYVDTDTTYTAGTGLTLTGTVFSNSAPDQIVGLTGSGATVVTGTYPNFTISSTDTVYTHPASHSISFITGLQAALDGKVDDSQVLTNVPAGAVFTDTVYTLPFTDYSSNWNAAYDWGDHALAGYANANHVHNYLPLSGGTLTGALSSNSSIATTYNVSDGTVSIFGYGIEMSRAGSYIRPTVNNASTLYVGNADALMNWAAVQIKTTSNNGLTVNGNTVWNTGNDGTGSGLDADLLDGQQGSYYYPASNPNGYTDDQTAAEILTAIKTVDGTGSGLDADLLDGQQGSYYAPASRTYLPTAGNYVWSNSTTAGSYPGPGLQCSFVRGADGWPDYGSVLHVGGRGGSDAGGDFQIYAGHGATNGGNYLRFRNADNSASPTDAWTEWKTIWGSGNDGSGSGLDADLLDGIQASSFLRSDASDTFVGDLTTGPNNHITFGPNSTWGSSLRIGGNGRTATGTEMASVVTTDGNLHLDAAASGNAIYLNYYAGTNGTLFGNGAGAITARMDGGGQLYKSTGTSNPYWNAANDGSGSGLDADLLDGWDSGHYTAANSGTVQGDWNTIFNTANGYTTGIYQVQAITSGAHSNYPTGVYAYGGVFAWRLANSTFKLYAAHTGDVAYQTGWSNDGYSGWRNILTNNNIGSYAWTSSNDGSGSGLDADTIDSIQGSNIVHNYGSSYYQVNNWMALNGVYGIYSPIHNNAHFYPNTANSYGAWRIIGARGGYAGIHLDTGNVNIGMYDSGGSGGEYNSNWGWYYYFNRSNGCLGVAGSSTSSSYGLYEQGGGIYSTGNVVAYSDRRVKENIRTIDNALETVEQMRGVYYNRIDDEEKKTVIGFIAQEVNEIEGAKPLVTYAEDVDQYGVAYGNAAGLLVEAVKQLSKQVKDLKNEIKELKNA